ncbi:hypothetical protein RYX36_018096, partial [Vicia faba]
MASLTTLEVKFKEFLEAKQMHQNSRPKIQKVDGYLRNRNNFEQHYSPKFVSIGPIHHNNQNLKLGENYKLIWAAKYIENTQQNLYVLHQKIADNIVELMSLFADNVLELANTSESLKDFCSLEEKLSWLLFVDGCFLLYILIYLKLQLDKPQDLNIKVDQLVLVMKDVLLLENQLPYLVLKLLWKNEDETELIYNMKNFLKYYYWALPDNKKTWRTPVIEENNSAENERTHFISNFVHRKKTNEMHVVDFQNKQPTHLLDLQRKIILTKSNHKIVVDDDTAASLLNLIAYEMCPDFKNDYGICSFVVFIDSLIDHAEDVKKLRSKGIL